MGEDVILSVWVDPLMSALSSFEDRGVVGVRGQNCVGELSEAESSVLVFVVSRNE